jgi:hypothetical protein
MKGSHALPVEIPHALLLDSLVIPVCLGMLRLQPGVKILGCSGRFPGFILSFKPFLVVSVLDIIASKQRLRLGWLI